MAFGQYPEGERAKNDQVPCWDAHPLLTMPYLWVTSVNGWYIPLCCLSLSPNPSIMLSHSLPSMVRSLL